MLIRSRARSYDYNMKTELPILNTFRLAEPKKKKIAVDGFDPPALIYGYADVKDM